MRVHAALAHDAGVGMGTAGPAKRSNVSLRARATVTVDPRVAGDIVVRGAMTATYSVIRPGVGQREPGALSGIVGRVTRPPSAQNAGGGAPVTTYHPVAGHVVR